MINKIPLALTQQDLGLVLSWIERKHDEIDNTDDMDKTRLTRRIFRMILVLVRERMNSILAEIPMVPPYPIQVEETICPECKDQNPSDARCIHCTFATIP